MAFVPEYEHDIFVSYAHVDDQSFIDAATGQERSSGWVATLVRHLKNELAQKVGRADAVSIWFDAHNLRGNHPLNDEIAARLERTALLIAILSPGYIASDWCQQEARLFASAGDDRGRRVFVVEKAPLEGDQPPESLRGRRAYKFWYRDRAEQPRTFATPLPHPDEIDYFRQIEDLARDLRDQCRAMRGDPAGRIVAVVKPLTASIVASAIGAAPLAPTVYASASAADAVILAEVTDDLEFKRAEVQRYLEQQGVPVLPEMPYPLGRVEFEAALDADLSHAKLFVQLLGPIAGKRPRDIPDGYGWLQLEGARRRSLPILQWRSPELDLEAIEWPRHRELLELETVQATSLESFKKAILGALEPPPQPTEPRRAGADRPLVFLNTESRHRDIASKIRGALGDRAVWAEPLFEGPAEMVREDLEQNLIDCDAMIMIYADNPGWARAQLRNYHKLSPRRDHPVRAIGLIDAPPAEKPELGFFLPELVTINGRWGIGSSTLNQLVASLGL
jgi:hypothetical protein